MTITAKAKIKVKLVTVAFIELPVSPTQLDKRSRPAFTRSSHKGFAFKCKQVWRGMIQNKLKVVKTKIKPAVWVKQSFRLTDPTEFEHRNLPGIDKPKVIKYAEWMKQQLADTGKVSIPPVIFAKDKQMGKTYFIDGNHRLMAAFLAGVLLLDCYQLDMRQLKRAYYVNRKGERVKLIEPM